MDLIFLVSSQNIDIEERLADYCGYPVMSARLRIGARDAGKIMVKNKIKRLPLVEKDGDKIVAMVTARDLVDTYREGL